jgi:hypothetical protein
MYVMHFVLNNLSMLVLDTQLYTRMQWRDVDRTDNTP